MNYKKILQSCLFLLFGYTASFAQIPYFEWINPKNALRERIYTDTWIHVKENKLGDNWIKVGGVTSSENFSKLEQVQVANSSYFVLRQDSLVWFTFNGSQRVYEFIPATSTFQRIDRTVFAGYNFDSSKFIRNDTLYSAGGYGFWHQNNIITYYYEDKREWELIRTNGKRPKTILAGYQGYDKEDDVFYSAAGVEHSTDKDARETFGNKVFKLNFKTYTWEELGEIQEKLPYKTAKEIYWTGRYFIQWAIKSLYIIDPKANTVYLFEDNKQLFHANPPKYFSKGDTVYYYWDKDSKPIKISVSNVLKSSTFVGPFYSRPNTNLYLCLSTLFAILLVLLYVYRNQLRGLKLHSILQQQELELVEALLALEEGTYLNGNELNDLLGLRGKSLENQRKIRMTVIHQINHKIKQNFNISEAIQRLDDPSDKRMKLYCLKQEVLKALVKKG